jgi:hypothetical protein
MKASNFTSSKILQGTTEKFCYWIKILSPFENNA